MYIVHMRFKTPDKYGCHSYARENESFSKLLQTAEEMRSQYNDVPVESIDIIDSVKPLEGQGCFQGTVIASLRVIK